MIQAQEETMKDVPDKTLMAGLSYTLIAKFVSCQWTDLKDWSTAKADSTLGSTEPPNLCGI